MKFTNDVHTGEIQFLNLQLRSKRTGKQIPFIDYVGSHAQPLSLIEDASCKANYSELACLCGADLDGFTLVAFYLAKDSRIHQTKSGDVNSPDFKKDSCYRFSVSQIF